jgi:hypothetical protein
MSTISASRRKKLLHTKNNNCTVMTFHYCSKSVYGGSKVESERKESSIMFQWSSLRHNVWKWFSHDVNMMFCWFFFSPIKDFYADSDILSREHQHCANVKASTEMGAHFSLITVWPHPDIPSTVITCMLRRKAINWSVERFISLFLFSALFKLLARPYCIKVCSTSCWMGFS